MDNRNLTVKELQILRRKAVEAVIKEGITQSKAATSFGFTPSTMSRYIKAYRLNGEASFNYKRRGVARLTNRYLSEEQSSELIAILLSKTPDEVGLEQTLWNSKVIRHFIAIRFSIHYSERGIRKLMSSMGFSSQKPIKRAYQQNADKVKRWLTEIYPAIKARASKEGARIYFADEMGIQSTDNRGRTYGLVGKTPVIKKSGSRFKANLLAAISPQGFMSWMVFTDTCDSQKFIEFLSRMRRQIKQKIFLIVDNLKVHHSKKVQHYINQFKEDIEIFFAPL
ncbi:Transposase and inactivated derivatives [Legionella busanensis]|uniref:Transposase and inactivated derivatives n=1 Tax=Legionella busanensis TaxID=190655 RepID=A0A378K9X2_9GAMM|nr:IS630 family transposase [Legionella busanensis]STX81506.1 Transposase and inactivated derivatives [Legionella busanensis]